MAPPHRLARRSALLVLLLTPLLLLSAACGSGSAQHRPALVGSFPANLEVLPGTLSAIRLDYDEPVTVLNPESVLVIADGLVIPVTSFQLDGDTDSVYVVPIPQTAFVPGAIHNVRIFQGLVINSEQHYPLDEENLAFELGPIPPIAAGAPQAVRIFDRDTFQLLDTIPTPNAGADDVVGVVSTQGLAGRRYWVQRSGPGAGTDSFAYFDEGDASMTDVPLTRSGMASTLVSNAGCLVAGRLGASIYVAYREEPEQQVRISRIDVATATETAALILSPIPGATTAPTGLALSLNRDELAIACSEGAGGRLVFVDVATFTEIDRDFATPGVQGAAMPFPPGEVQSLIDRYITTALDGTGTANAQQVIIGPYTTVQTPSLTTGTGAGMMVTLDRVLAVESVQGYANSEALVARSYFSSFSAPVPLRVSDDVGGVSTNTTGVIAAARNSSANFFLLVHDGGILTRWVWNTVELFQVDLDPMTVGVQAVDGGMLWADIVSIGRDYGQFPPP